MAVVVAAGAGGFVLPCGIVGSGAGPIDSDRVGEGRIEIAGDAVLVVVLKAEFVLGDECLFTGFLGHAPQHRVVALSDDSAVQAVRANDATAATPSATVTCLAPEDRPFLRWGSVPSTSFAVCLGSRRRAPSPNGPLMGRWESLPRKPFIVLEAVRLLNPPMPAPVAARRSRVRFAGFRIADR